VAADDDDAVVGNESAESQPSSSPAQLLHPSSLASFEMDSVEKWSSTHVSMESIEQIM